MPLSLNQNPIPDWQRERGGLRDAKLLFHIPFEAPHYPLGRSAENSADAWAAHAIDTLRQNRERFGSPKKIGEAPVLEVGPIPDWVRSAVTLPELSPTTAGAWEKTIRQMIAEQLPDFHLHPDWKSVEREDAKGAQFEILQRIASAIRARAA